MARDVERSRERATTVLHRFGVLARQSPMWWIELYNLLVVFAWAACLSLPGEALQENQPLQLMASWMPEIFWAVFGWVALGVGILAIVHPGMTAHMSGDIAVILYLGMIDIAILANRLDRPGGWVTAVSVLMAMVAFWLHTFDRPATWPTIPPPNLPSDFSEGG